MDENRGVCGLNTQIKSFLCLVFFLSKIMLSNLYAIRTNSSCLYLISKMVL